MNFIALIVSYSLNESMVEGALLVRTRIRVLWLIGLHSLLICDTSELIKA